MNPKQYPQDHVSRPGYLSTGIVQTKPEEFTNPSVPRGTIWARLQQPTHPDFAPYVKVKKIAPDGREYMVYPQNHDGRLSKNFDQSLLRRREGQRFQKEHSRYPCPEGWLESTDRSYCERFGDSEKALRGIHDGPPKAEAVGLYSDHAYVPRMQYFANPDPPQKSNYSDSTFVRSHDPRTGGYQVFYEPKPGPSVATYLPLSMITSDVRYDPSWHLAPERSRVKSSPLPTGDSYL